MDVDREANTTDRKSTLGFCLSLGSREVSWYRRKQKSVALIFVKAEYMVANMATCEAIWIKKNLARFFYQELDPIII